VIQRMCAGPGEDGRSFMSAKIESRWIAKYARKLPPDIFVPRPKVDSAVVTLTPRPRAELPTFLDTVLDRLLRMGFGQRRKMLRKLLPEPPQPWPQIAQAAGFLETARAEELTLKHWVQLTHLYDTNALKDVPQKDSEVFDVVDADDNVVSQEIRKVVHAKGLMHRAVHIFVFNKAGELLLQKRSHLKDTMPEKWDSSAAGHVDSGEDYLTSAVRELQEELGLSAPPENFKRLARIAPCKNTGMEWVELFGVWQYEGKVDFPASEIECVRAFPLAEVQAWITQRPQDWAPGFIECWNQWDRETEPQ
jgi:16S rRNA (adenine1518-N6/adenine1519-N6)-dimethyltransferase